MQYNQLKEAIIKILQKLQLPINEDVVNLISEIACVESNCGDYIKQINGPACGIFQIEPNTAKDIINNYLAYRTQYKNKVMSTYINSMTIEENLMYNLAFSVALCRIFFLRISESVPNTVEGRAEYWKKYYNTAYGKGTVEDYIKKVEKYGNKSIK